jgi:hypothetical protein
MTIDPKTSMYVNLALAIIMAIGSGTLGLPPGVSPDVAKGIMAWCAWISVVANFIMHGLSSSTAGPAVSASKEN